VPDIAPGARPLARDPRAFWRAAGLEPTASSPKRLSVSLSGGGAQAGGADYQPFGQTVANFSTRSDAAARRCDPLSVGGWPSFPVKVAGGGWLEQTRHPVQWFVKEVAYPAWDETTPGRTWSAQWCARSRPEGLKELSRRLRARGWQFWSAWSSRSRSCREWITGSVDVLLGLSGETSSAETRFAAGELLRSETRNLEEPSSIRGTGAVSTRRHRGKSTALSGRLPSRLQILFDQFRDLVVTAPATVVERSVVTGH
jgi:hypothetical protein